MSKRPDKDQTGFEDDIILLIAENDMIKNISAVMFDMDGVIVDSREAMKRGWNHVSTNYDINIGFEKFEKKIGKPFETILEELGIEQDKHKHIKESYGEITSKCKEMIRPYKGIVATIRKLKSFKVSIAVVTSKEFWRADALLDHFNIPVDCLITPEQTRRGKPSGEPLIKALKELGAEYDESIYIGDMKSDQESAESCDIKYFHARWGYGANYGYKALLNYPEEVIEYVSAINQKPSQHQLDLQEYQQK